MKLHLILTLLVAVLSVLVPNNALADAPLTEDPRDGSPIVLNAFQEDLIIEDATYDCRVHSLLYFLDENSDHILDPGDSKVKFGIIGINYYTSAGDYIKHENKLLVNSNHTYIIGCIGEELEVSLNGTCSQMRVRFDIVEEFNYTHVLFLPRSSDKYNCNQDDDADYGEGVLWLPGVAGFESTTRKGE